MNQIKNQTAQESDRLELDSTFSNTSKVDYWDKYCRLNTGADACRIYDN